MRPGDGPDHDPVVLHDMPETGKGLVHERPSLDAHPHHADEAVRKLPVLHRAGEGEQTFDGADDFLLRVDEHTDAQRVAAEEFGIGGVFFRADAGELRGLGRDGVGEEAGHDVGLVAVRHREENGGVLSPGGLEYGRPRSRSEDGLHIHVVFYAAELVGVLVNDHDLLLFLGQALRDVKAHFARSHNDDLQFFAFLGSASKQHNPSIGPQKGKARCSNPARALSDFGSIDQNVPGEN